MILLKNRNTDARFNLALEEYLLKHYPTEEKIVSIWQNENAVIIGRNQDFHREIFEPYVIENNIQVVRRISGGGAVYHDMGNVNFTFIEKKGKDQSYETFLKPILKVLSDHGVNAIFSGRNDLVIMGKKISGNAQYSYKDKIMHHGTLLFKVNLEKLNRALNPDKTKLQAKGIQSVRSRVTNILDELNRKMDVSLFINNLEHYFIKEFNATVVEIDQVMKEKVEKLAEEKYDAAWWNIGKTPSWLRTSSSFFSEKRFASGLLGIKAHYRANKIQAIHFYGDFLSQASTEEIEKLFQGTREEDIREILSSIDLKKYFGNITMEETLEVFEELFRKAKKKF